MNSSTSSRSNLVEWLRQRRCTDRQPLENLLGDRRLEARELVNIISVDLIECRRRGFPRNVESYLTAFPEIGSNPEWVLDLVDAELCTRREGGEQIDDSEYPNRFPALGDRFQRLLELERMEAGFANLALQESQAGSELTVDGSFAHSASSMLNSSDMAFCHPPQNTKAVTAGQPWLTPPEGIRLTQLVASRPGVQLYRGIRHTDRSPMAVKVIRSSVADEMAVDAFMDRLELFSKLANEYCETADSVEVNGHHYVITRRWMEAVDWSKWQACQTNLLSVLSPIAMLADVLQMCHHANLPHGHFHPANVLVDHTGRIKIVDFGMGSRHTLAESWYPVASRSGPYDVQIAKLRDTFGITMFALTAIDRFGASNRSLTELKNALSLIQRQPQISRPHDIGEILRCFLADRRITIPESLRPQRSRLSNWWATFYGT